MIDRLQIATSYQEGKDSVGVWHKKLIRVHPVAHEDISHVVTKWSADLDNLLKEAVDELGESWKPLLD
jgi:hypothetical protein